MRGIGSGFSLEAYNLSEISFQILEPIADQITQFPLAYIHLSTPFDQFFYLALQLAGDDITGSLPPGRLIDLFLHSLNMSVLLLQYLTDLHQITTQFLLLGLHILADVFFALFERLVDYKQQPFTQVLELIRNDTVHPGVEVFDLDVDVSYLVAHLHAQVL